MASYSIVYPALPAGAASSSNGGVSNNGIQFSITAPGCQLSGYYFYVPSGGTTTGSSYTFALYSTTNGTTGTLITGTSLTGSGTYTAAAWNYAPLSSPVALVNGTTYVAVAHWAGAILYMYVHFFWSSGTGANGIISGPISAPNGTNALNGAQQPYSNPGSGSISFPTLEFDNSWYGVDINVTQVVYGIHESVQAQLPGHYAQSQQVYQPGLIYVKLNVGRRRGAA
jgi:hypothetical protein